MSYFLLGLAFVAAVIVLSRWFQSANSIQISSALRWAGLVACGFATVIFFLTGPLPLAFFSVLGFLYLLTRMSGPLPASAKPRRTKSKQSRIETTYLDMILDHDSGQMAGRVRTGPFAGRDLSEMRPEELMALWRECVARDEQSARVLESFLDRHFGGWRDAAKSQDEAPRRAGGMSVDEAYKVLGVSPKASEREIKEAHRKLMRKHHPDKGGSAELAARLNEARDVLLGG
ncbi:MAG: DnaJ domain-containing protein [Alphaproteobacteria bacterium]|nr:DnaJ domain-containing protein [Alphaproteobacteria bacterium]